MLNCAGTRGSSPPGPSWRRGRLLSGSSGGHLNGSLGIIVAASDSSRSGDNPLQVAEQECNPTPKFGSGEFYPFPAINQCLLHHIQRMINPALFGPSCDCACAPTLPSRASSHLASDKKSDA